MAKLLLDIEDALLAKVLAESQEQEISLETFIHEALGNVLAGETPTPVRKSVNVEALIAHAISQVELKAPQSEFMLVDLCTEEDWEALSGGERKSLGKGFRKAVESQSPPIAAYVRRTSSNKAVYKRL